MIRAFVVFASLLFASAAHAQESPPFVYTMTLGTTSTTVLPVNFNRKRVLFSNPNATAMIAICPIGPSRSVPFNPALIVAVVNGPGCITILPFGSFDVTGSTPSGPQQSMGSAWVGIASAAGSSFTALEFE
jgi:hypothetical protein